MMKKLVFPVVSTLLLLLSVEHSRGFVSPASRCHYPSTLTTPGLVSSIHNVPPTLQMMPTPDWFVDTTTSLSTAPQMLLAFTDQGQNLAGIFFQASLLPYLVFLYFLSFRANRIPALANYGFQFVLLFVASTIPSGIVTKSVYGTSLANVDWLHGGAEALLTVANCMLVLGFKEAAMSTASTDSEGQSKTTSMGLARLGSLACFGLFAVACTLGTNTFGFDVHAPFLAGLGNIPQPEQVLPWVLHSEPANALSIPTWMIHFSSVVEFLVAMQLVWNFSTVSGNEKWKGLTWGMLPLHASGICACVYHFFYNAPVLQLLVTLQAAFTCLGNITCAAAAYRIANSNGWTLDELNPFPPSSTSSRGLVATVEAQLPLAQAESQESNTILAAKIVGLTVTLSYLVKYGELGLDLPFIPNLPVALTIVLGIPAITAFSYAKEDGFNFNFGDTSSKGEGLSMANVKEYGVAGTIAYVLTELAFWVVALPFASWAYYQTTGHWPDLADASDRATVVGFVFAGANVARLLVPLRLGAALALAPWVKDQVLDRLDGTQEEFVDTGKFE